MIKEIREKIKSNYPEKWWGDDFDSRFNLISQLKNLKEKSVLDIGGGVGIISSELDKSNNIINLDLSIKDLKICNNRMNKNLNTACGEMTRLPFQNNFFDVVISGSVLQYAKIEDVKKDQVIKKRINEFPSIEESLGEIHRVLKPNGILYLVTPNNSFYKLDMLSYDELKKALSNHFKIYSIFFYNTFPQLGRKFNLANAIPKIISKFINPDKVISLLIKEDKGFKKNSVSFYVKAIKN